MVPLKRGHHPAADPFRGGGADENGGKHVRLRFSQFLQRQNADLLPLPADVAGDPADGFRRFLFQQHVARALQGVLPVPGSGVVQADGKITFRRAAQPRFDHVPVGQPVGQRDHAEVVPERSADQRCAGYRRRHTRDYDDLHARIFFTQFQHRARHAVNAGVPAAYQRCAEPFRRPGQTVLTALHFSGHPGGVKGLPGEKRLQQFHILRVAAENLRFLQRRTRGPGHVRFVSRPHAYKIQFPHLTSSSHIPAALPQGQMLRPRRHICFPQANRRCRVWPPARRRCPRRFGLPQRLTP